MGRGLPFHRDVRFGCLWSGLGLQVNLLWEDRMRGLGILAAMLMATPALADYVRVEAERL